MLKTKQQLLDDVLAAARRIGHDRESCAVSSLGSAYKCNCGIADLEDAVTAYDAKLKK